jgi:hypothetical protein
MTLTAEQFGQVLHSLGAIPMSGVEDKRRAARITHRCNVQITLGSDPRNGKKIEVLVRDFSPRGICILLDNSVRSGANFIIRLGRPNEEDIHLLCTVVHCRDMGEKMFVIGAEFTCLVDTTAKPLGSDTVVDLQRIRKSMLD